MHGAKFDLHALGLDPNDSRFRAQIHDTALLIHLYDSRERKALEYAEQRWLGTHRKADHLKAHRGKRKKIAEWPLEQTADYCTDDARITEGIFYVVAPKVGKADLTKLYFKEIRYLKLLWSIERRGIHIDPDALEAQWADLSVREAKLEKQLYTYCGYEFNWQAPKQLSKALYDDLGIPKPRDPSPDHHHTMTKYYTESATSSKLLVEKVKHPIAGTVLALRETSKLRATLEGWPRYLDADGALHTSFNQANRTPDAASGGTRTGRLSSTDVALQNLANVTRRSQASAAYGEGGLLRTGAYKIRNIIVSRPGMTLVAIDYSQQEARLLALLSGEEHMLAMLRSKTDIYMDMAEAIWGVRDAIHRRWAKDTTLAVNYGMNEASLAEYLGVDRARAHIILHRYFQAFPRIPAYLREVARIAKAHGAIRTWEGRLWRPDNDAEVYKGVNAEIQGGAAGLLSVAALRVAKYLEEVDAGWIVLLIHDEVTMELYDDVVDTVIPRLCAIMALTDIFGVPFPVEAKVGRRFGSLEKYEVPV